MFSQPGAHIDAVARLLFVNTHGRNAQKRDALSAENQKHTKGLYFWAIECFVFNAEEMSASADSLETHCEIAGIILNAWLY